MEGNTPEKNPFIIYYLTATATLGGFLFGYDTGIINGALILITSEYEMDGRDIEMIVASTVGAAAIFSLFSGIVADVIGRKGTIMISAVIFTVGGILLGLAGGLYTLIIGRAVVGIAIGFVSSVNPIYISECAPHSIRGLLITMNQLFITLGIVLSALFAALLQQFQHGWRYMMGISAIPAFIQFVLFFGLPESPRFLMMKGKEDKAENVLKRIRKKDIVTEELSDMRRSLEEESGSKGWAIWVRIMTTPHVRKALFVGCMLQMFQQFCGINAVIYYSSSILRSAGFSSSMAIWLAVIPATINFFATFIGMWAVESLGRKLVLAFSWIACGISLVILGASFFLSEINSPASAATNEIAAVISVCNNPKTCHACIDYNDCGFCYEGSDSDVQKGACVNISFSQRNYAQAGRCSQVNNHTEEFLTPGVNFSTNYCPTSFGWIAVAGMILYVLGFAPGAGPMPWTINAEIYPQWGRSIANSLATVANWTCNVILSAYFLTLISTITAWGTFLLFCGVSILGAIFVLIYVPETKDKSLEEIELLFMTEQVRNQTIAMRHKRVEDEETAEVEQVTDLVRRPSFIQPGATPGRSGSMNIT